MITQEEFTELAAHFPYADRPHFIMMPNHVHAIIVIGSVGTHTSASVAGEGQIDASDKVDAHVCVPTKRTGLSVVVGAYNGAVTMFARRNNIDFCWQRRYHDHNIRDQNELNRISEYITNNPIVWNKDCFN